MRVNCRYCFEPIAFPWTRCKDCINNNINDEYMKVLLDQRLKK
jgi:hypothetical protein